MKQQSGFTLIELVVVIVLLGILAATAVPRFGTVVDDANEAVADGIAAAIYSAAAIQVAAGGGAAPTFSQIMSNLDCQPPTGAVVTVTTGGASTDDSCSAANDNLCTGPTTVTVDVDGQTSMATLSASLCSG